MKQKPVILCVDDEILVLDNLKAQLKGHFLERYSIETAESGEEALEIIQQLREENTILPVVISDHIMPGMRGDELLIQIQKILPQTLKILLTGQADADAVGNALNQAKLYRYIAKPWESADLSLTVEEAVKSYFQDKTIQKQKETLELLVQRLQEANENLEEKIKDRTEEVLMQKKEIERSYENIRLLSEIGREVSANLSLRYVVDNLYQNVRNLMDADLFVIGIHDEQKDCLEFIGSKNQGQNLPSQPGGLEDDDPTSIWCFKNQEPILMNDYQKEYTCYISPSKPSAWNDSEVNSMICIPLFTMDKSFGILAVYSYRKDAYTSYQFNLLKNLAIYVANALGNAKIHEALEKQKSIIEYKNQNITASISYAKRIQDAMLPRMEEIQSYLPDSFILFKPRDIVSGDFYWFTAIQDKIIIAAIDCTGHGVPGAFMSMIGNDLLTDIVNARQVLEPHHILNKLNSGVRQALRQHETSNRDGMAAAICVIDKKTKKLHFAGAKHPLVLIQGGETQVIRGERFEVGGIYRDRGRGYRVHTIDISQDSQTAFYIFSDGYPDQFGGENGKKFMLRRLVDTLSESQDKPMEEQEMLLHQRLLDWQRTYEQIDDILVIGVRV